MRVLVDSSVIVAAVARPGVCTQFLEELVDGHIWLISGFILDEVARKLGEKFHIPPAVVGQTIERIRGLCEAVDATEVGAAACRDPNDLPVLGAAVDGKADILVTVDRDLLDLGVFDGIPIMRPGEAFRTLRSPRQ